MSDTKTNRILLAYATNAGSTSEVAQAIAAQLNESGFAVDVRPVEQVENLDPYGAVILGGPMILGWHRASVRFLKRHREALAGMPAAYFFTAASLTKTGESELHEAPVFIDPYLARPARRPGKLSFRERYATVTRYLGPALKAAPQVRPLSAAFFAGKIDYTRLKPLHMLFVMLIIGAQPGDRRNWDAVRDWTAALAAKPEFARLAGSVIEKG